MKRLLNDPVMNDTGWPDHNKKVKRETNLRSDRRLLPLSGWISKALPQWPYIRGSDHVFSSRSPSRSLNKSAGNQLQNGANKKAKELSLSLFALIINLANKNGRGAQGYSLFGARDHSLCGAHGAYKNRFIGSVHQLYKAVTSFPVNIKPTRLTTPFQCMRSLFLWCALSLQRLISFFWWISSLHDLVETLKTLQFNWPLDSHSNWIAWTPFAGVKRFQSYHQKTFY